MDKQIYIHYGSEKFDPNIGFPIINHPYYFDASKPHGGLWASREDSIFGWRDFLKDNKIKNKKLDKSFKFVFKDNTNIIQIGTVDDLFRLPQNTMIPAINSPDYYNDPMSIVKHFCIDFEKCLVDGVDAIELYWYGNKRSDLVTNYALTWDCDSVVVLNPNTVQPI